ncbi:MAG TPA: sulfatase [Phycisphaerae bacterium]|nr:sulfatase [Phycisphaerae bacterium]
MPGQTPSTRGTRTRSILSRRDFLAAAGAGALTLTAGRWLWAAPDAGGRKPNIIVILADDLGYADVGYQGCKDISTPHIDSIAAGGVRFTDGYVSCPVCSPTRAGLMTGRYQNRFGHEFNTGPAPEALTEHVGLPVEETTIADVMKSAGYATGVIGKWHLGIHPKYHPFRRGFDEFFGFLAGSHSYFQPLQPKWSPVQRGNEPVNEKAYLTDAFTREAVDFIGRHKEKPFFLYLPYNAPHTPMQAPPKYLKRFASIEDAKRRTYAAMVSGVDDGVGAVLSALKDNGLREDTLVIFLSDNGGPPKANASRNDPLSGGKSSAFEGGIRVPFAMQWPGRITPGSVYREPVISLDILPTAAAAAGAKLPAQRPVDGVNILPYVTGAAAGAPHEILFWRRGKDIAVRKGRWKLRSFREKFLLHDLSADLAEKTDLSAQHPEVFRELREALARWESEMAPPRWIPVTRNAPATSPAGARPARAR